MSSKVHQKFAKKGKEKNGVRNLARIQQKFSRNAAKNLTDF